MHKKALDTSLVLQRCVSCDLIDFVNTEGLCGDHDADLLKRVRLRKQKEIKAVIDEAGLVYRYYDKVIDGGVCGKERPDFWFECGTHIVVLEVDENQHTNYECEEARMKNLVYSAGQPILFVRYNPDEYCGQKGIRPRDRHQYLVSFLRRVLVTRSFPRGSFAEVVYLFYDGFKVSEPAQFRDLVIV